MSELKPCPFCGSTELRYISTVSIWLENYGYVKCSRCGCTVPVRMHGENVKEPCAEWNRRVGEVK